MKNTLLSSAFVAILGLALASVPVTAQTPAPAPTAAAKPAKAKSPHFGGTLTAVDATANTITVESHKGAKVLTLSIGSTAKITKDKKPATLADFAVGDKVQGVYTVDASGTNTVTALSQSTKVAKTAKVKASTEPATKPSDTQPSPAAAVANPAPAPAAQ